jgi:RNA polymerase sigma-70 factor (ECF subfamily)
MWRTSTRIAIDLLRRRRLGVEVRREPPDAAGGGRPADAVMAARQQLAAIATAAPRDELEVAMLCRVDGLTQPEAAEVCDVSERTVRRLLDRFDRRVAQLGGRTP